MQVQNSSVWMDEAVDDLGQVRRQSCRFKAGVHGVASLRVGELEIKQVSSLLAHAGAPQSDACWSKCAQIRGYVGMRDLGHAVSNLSG
jgi:hypothetical protein